MISGLPSMPSGLFFAIDHEGNAKGVDQHAEAMRPDAPPLSTGQDEGSGGHELRRRRQPALAENGSRGVVPLQTAKEHLHLSALTAGLIPEHDFVQPDDCHNLYVRAALSSEEPMRRNTAARKKRVASKTQRTHFTMSPQTS